MNSLSNLLASFVPVNDVASIVFFWYWLELDRARIGGDGAQNLHVPPERRKYIEHRAERGDAANGMLVASLLADLRLVSQADAVVGTSRSFVTHAAQLLIWAPLPCQKCPLTYHPAPPLLIWAPLHVNVHHCVIALETPTDAGRLS